MSTTRIVRIVVCVLAIVLTVAAISSAVGNSKESGKEQKLTKKDLPVAVLAAFEKAYPKAEIKEVGKESGDSVTTYEIVSVEGKAKRTVAYTADGTLTEIEEVIAEKDLPDAAKQSLAKDYPKGTVEKIERVTKGGAVTYEATVVSGKERTEVVFDSSGKIVKSEKKAGKEKDED